MSATPRVTAVTPSLTADDIAKSLDFYTRVVGLEMLHRFEEEGELVGAVVGSGDLQIFLSQDDWAKGRDRDKGVGFRLFLATPDDIDRLAAGIRQRGGELDDEPTDREWGSRDFAITDPSGFKLSFTTPMEEGDVN